MAKIVQFRRDSTSACSLYTGPVGEIIIDTDLLCIRLQDGVTPGGRVIYSTQTTADGDVKAPATIISGYVPTWSGVGKGLSTGVKIGTTSGCLVALDGLGRLPAIDGSQLQNLPMSGSGDVKGPGTTTANKIPIWSSAQKTLLDGLFYGMSGNGVLLQLTNDGKLPVLDGSNLTMLIS